MAKKLTCKRGHLKTLENTYKGGGCKECYHLRNSSRHSVKLTGLCKHGHPRTVENVGSFGQCIPCQKNRYYGSSASRAKDPENFLRRKTLSIPEKRKEDYARRKLREGIPNRPPKMSSEERRIRSNELKNKYRKMYPHRFLVKNHERRVKSRSLPWDWNLALWLTAQKEWDNCCVYCGTNTEKLTQDHFIPISHPDCPGTVPHNMVPACNMCNARKNNTLPHEWISDMDKYTKITNWLAKRGEVVVRKPTYTQLSLF